MKTAEEMATEYAEREASANEKLTLEPFGIEELKTYAYHDFLAGYNAREQWISVEKQLPENTQNILAVDEGGTVYSGFYLSENDMFYQTALTQKSEMDYTTFSDRFTHWQELPNAPKP